MSLRFTAPDMSRLSQSDCQLLIVLQIGCTQANPVDGTAQIISVVGLPNGSRRQDEECRRSKAQLPPVQ